MKSSVKTVLDRIVDVFGRALLWVQTYVLAVIGRAPFSILLTILGCIVFSLPQTREFALIFASRDTPWSQLIIFFVALTIWSLSAWYCALLNLRRIMSVGRRRRETIDENREPFNTIRLWLPRLLGLLPYVAIAGVFVANASISGSNGVIDRNLAAVTVVLGAAVFAFMVWRRRIPWIARAYGGRRSTQYTELQTNSEVALAAGFALSTLIFFALLIWPVGVAVYFGAPALVCHAIASWILFGDILLVHAPKARGWPSLAVVPLVLFVVFSPFNDNHAVRLSAAAAARPFLREAVSDHVDRWLAERDREIKSKPFYYVYVVAAAGGGIRAAYWTASVLGKLQDDNPAFADHLFAVSGVSGGSLGAATFVALVADDHGGRALNCAPDGMMKFERCADAVLKRDFASPVIGYMLYPDLTQRFFLPGLSRLDRARAMELSWESAWKDAVGTDRFQERMDLLWDGAKDTRVPSLLLNSTRVETGKRVIASNLRITGAETMALKAQYKGRDAAAGDFPDAYDLFDARLDARGMALSTAVHNSARFTYVSPLGTVYACRDDKEPIGCTPGAPRQIWGRIVDGGYFENSGAETARDLIAVLKDKIGDYNEAGRKARRPYEVRLAVILITNDPDETIPGAPIDEAKAGSAFLSEVFGPVTTLFQTRDARGSFAQAETDVDAKKRSEGEIYMEAVYFRLKRDETAQELKKKRLHKPPLGWYLASESIDAMRNILVEQEGLKTVAAQLKAPSSR